MNSLKHSNRTICIDGVDVNVIQDIYHSDDQYVVVSSKITDNRVEDMIVTFDVFNFISEAEQYIDNNVVLNLNEAEYSDDQLDTLDRAFIAVNDDYKPLVVKNTHLIKSVYSMNGVVCVHRIEYANKCSLSDKNVVVSSCYCYKENGEHWTKSAKVWKELTVHNSIDECIRSADKIVSHNYAMLKTLVV